MHSGGLSLHTHEKTWADIQRARARSTITVVVFVILASYMSHAYKLNKDMAIAPAGSYLCITGTSTTRNLKCHS